MGTYYFLPAFALMLVLHRTENHCMVPRKLDNPIPGINVSYPIKKVILGINWVPENIVLILG